MGTGMTKEHVLKNEFDVRQRGPAIRLRQRRQPDRTTIIDASVITGKFDTAYKAETHTTYDPPLMG